jgi:hypothetical protein
VYRLALAGQPVKRGAAGSGVAGGVTGAVTATSTALCRTLVLGPRDPAPVGGDPGGAVVLGGRRDG